MLIHRCISTVSALAVGVMVGCGSAGAPVHDRSALGSPVECGTLAPVERPPSLPFSELGRPAWPYDDRLPVALLVTSEEDPAWAGVWLIDPGEQRIVAAWEGTREEAGGAWVRIARETADRLVPSDAATDPVLEGVRGGAGLKIRRPPPPPPPVPGGDDPFAAWLMESALAMASSGDHSDGEPDSTILFEDERHELPALERLDDVDLGVALDAGLDVRAPVLLVATFADEPDRVDAFVIDAERGAVRRWLTGSATRHRRALVVGQAKVVASNLFQAATSDQWTEVNWTLAGIKVRKPPVPPPPVPGGGELSPWAAWLVVHGARALDAPRSCGF